MKTIPKYEMKDVITASDFIKEDEYNVIKNGEIILVTDDLYKAQNCAGNNNAVIAGKGILYMFSITQP